MGDAGAGCTQKAGGRPTSPLLQPLPLVRPCLYVVALVPALDLMRFLFLRSCGRTAPHRLHTRLLRLLLKGGGHEAEAEVGRGAEFFQMQSPACAATARSSLLKMVVMGACCTGRQTRRRRRRPRTRRVGRDEAGVPSRITIPTRTSVNGKAHPTRCRSPSPSRSRSCQARCG
ncbi:hypothetical protein B0H14DRAFT_2987637 [Mycena olivaceomarginata]|nr:hypothetical protein B0H14DRAFT_2987637 [Mycena olivaceomarginata]